MKALGMALLFVAGAALHSWLGGALGPWLPGLAPHLLLVLTIVVALSEGSVPGELMGFLWGFYLDTVGVHLFGSGCLLLTVAGHLAGGLRRQMDVANVLSQAATVAIATVAFHAAMGLLSALLLKEALLPTWSLFVVQPFVNALIGAILFPLLDSGGSRRGKVFYV